MAGMIKELTYRPNRQVPRSSCVKKSRWMNPQRVAGHRTRWKSVRAAASGEEEKPPVQLIAEIYSEEEPSEQTALTSSADIAVNKDGPVDQVSEIIHAEAVYKELDKEEKEEGIQINLGQVIDTVGTVELPIVPSTDASPPDIDILNNAKTIPSLTLAQVLAFSIPAFAGILIDPLMSFVDTACVGKISSVQLAALGPNTAIFGFVLQLFQCFITYTCAQVSRLSSRGAHEEMYKVVSDGLMLAVGLGTAAACMVICFANPLLSSMGVSAQMMSAASIYLKIRAIGLPAVAICMVSGATCLGRKDANTPLLVAILSLVLNACGDILLIFGPPKMGIAGAALATTVSTCIAAAVFVWKLSRSIPLKVGIPSVKDIMPFINTSTTLTVRNMSIMVNFTAMSLAASKFGTLAIASHQVAVSIFMIGCLTAEPFSQCIQSYLASIASLKRRSAEEHRYLMGATRLMGKVALIVGAAMGLLACSTCYMSQLFTNDVLIGNLVSQIGPLVGLSVFASCMNCVSDGFSFAAADYKFTAITAFGNIPILLGILALGRRLSWGFSSVWTAMFIFYAVRFCENILRISYINRVRSLKAKEV